MLLLRRRCDARRHEDLTVEENLSFAAEFRLPSTADSKLKAEVVTLARLAYIVAYRRIKVFLINRSQ